MNAKTVLLSPAEQSAFRDRLIHVLTDYDRKQSTRKHYNRHALGIYFQRVDDICADIAAGADPRAAIVAGFTGSLLSAVLRGMKLEKPTDSEWKGEGSVCYNPVARDDSDPNDPHVHSLAAREHYDQTQSDIPAADTAADLIEPDRD